MDRVAYHTLPDKVNDASLQPHTQRLSAVLDATMPDKMNDSAQYGLG